MLIFALWVIWFLSASDFPWHSAYRSLFFVFLQIVGTNSDEQQKMFGRHFEIEDELVSHISRRSIDILKANYRVSLNFMYSSLFGLCQLWLLIVLLNIQDELSIDEWKLVVKLKKLFEIP